MSSAKNTMKFEKKKKRGNSAAGEGIQKTL